LCSFLLAGQAEVGKKTMAYVMAEHLFGNRNALFHISLNETYRSITDIKIISEEQHGVSLLNAIQQTPYAVILIENVDQIPSATFNLLFNNILTYGYAFDEHGKKYDFRQSIFVVTTTLGSERIAMLTQSPPVYETGKTMDLIQLVLNEHPSAAPQVHAHLSPQELCEEILPTLEGYFSPAILQHFNIIPFLPLDYASLEKIMRLKVKVLAKRLETHYGIELSYAPEVIKFLAHEALWRKPNAKPLNKLLEQYLYSAVSNEILAYADDKNRPRRLVLQLNDDGQLLRCEFVSAMGANIYSL
jgi:ATP-dependent Clp protease ATP-binding subunit ClpA